MYGVVSDTYDFYTGTLAGGNNDIVACDNGIVELLGGNDVASVGMKLEHVDLGVQS